MQKLRRFKQLDKRLSAIAEFVRENATVCDIGTDHAHLPCFLARSGRYGQIYASDLNPKPLTFAKAEIEKQEANVILLQSDGLQNVPPCDDVIIAGMGGELITEIIANCPFKNPNLRLILQPMTKQEILRQALPKLGYTILEEKIIREKNKIYTIIYAKG